MANDRYDNRDDDWASQVPERRWSGPYEDYGWERGESGLAEFRDPSVHRQPYDRGLGGMEGRHYGGEIPFRAGRVPYERTLGDEGYERPGRQYDRASGRERYERYAERERRARNREGYGRDYTDEERRRDERYRANRSSGRERNYRDESTRWRTGDVSYGRDRDFARERYGPEQAQFDRESNREAYGRSYGARASRYGAGDSERSGNYGLDREMGAGGMPQWQSEPVGWSYTEIWIVPGPMTGRGPKGYETSDERIYEDVCERMTQHGDLDASDIEVKTENGEVTLEGTVPERRMKRLAEDLADQTPGVRDVHNHLRVQKPQEMKAGQGEAR